MPKFTRGQVVTHKLGDKCVVKKSYLMPDDISTHVSYYVKWLGRKGGSVVYESDIKPDLHTLA